MPARIKYERGELIGKLIYLEDAPYKKLRKAKFKCPLCGGTTIKTIMDVKFGNISSCGCLRKRLMTLHGDSLFPRDPMYDLWEGIKGRCYGKNNVAYKHYGGRGIKLYGGWKNNYPAFKEWMISNIGYKPSPRHTLDRIKNDGDYEPNNLRWATSSQQNSNKTRRNG